MSAGSTLQLCIPLFRPVEVTRSKMEGGSLNTRVSRSSNSNSFPHAGTPQAALNFPCLAPDLISRSTTIQVPHFGQVTQEQRMRSAIAKL